MKEQLIQRLAELKSQFEHGRKVLGDLEAQATTMRTTLLRISGAIEVIEEMLAQSKSTTANDTTPAKVASVPHEAPENGVMAAVAA